MGLLYGRAWRLTAENGGFRPHRAVGRFGVMTSYESWFPETTRLLGYKGADSHVLKDTYNYSCY